MAEVFPSRAWPAWAAALAALVGGVVAGAGVKAAERYGLPGASDFGNYFGLWILLAAAIAAWSHSRRDAVLHVVIFLLAMVASFYVSTLLLLGYFLTHLFLAWTVVALVLAPPFAALVWQARGTGWMPALATALPIGLLLAEAYSLRWVLGIHGVQFGFDVAAAAALLMILPKGYAQRLRVLALAPVIALGARVVIEYAWGVVTRVI